MPKHSTLTSRVRPAAVLVVVVLAGVVSIAGPFSAAADQELKGEQANGLAPITFPISIASVPWVFATLCVPLLLMAGVITLIAPVPSTRWIAMACAGLKGVLMGGIGAVVFAYSFAPENNIDGLVGLAMLFFSVPVLVAGVAYFGAAFASRSRGLPWRVVGAFIDAGLSWFIAWGVILEGLAFSGLEFGSWPLVWACIFAAVWLAATVPVVVNAIPDQWLNRARVDTQGRSRLGPFRRLPIDP